MLPTDENRARIAECTSGVYEIKKDVLHDDIKLGIPPRAHRRNKRNAEGKGRVLRDPASRENAPNDARFRAHNVMMRKQ